MTETGYRKAILGVALGSALLCLPFLGSAPLFDPDEGYYPAAAAESLREGHPLDLTLNGEPRWNKPPLSYALMQVSMSVLGVNEFAVRLPSVLEGAALVAILGLVVSLVAGGRAGLLASVVLASSLGHQVMTRAAHPEMGLVLGTATAQLLLARWFASPPEARCPWVWVPSGLAMGFGFLAKGPVALAMPALMLLAGMFVVPREGRPRWSDVGRVFGLAAALALALAAPWFLWMGSRHPEFWSTVLGEIGRQAEKDPDGFRANPLFFVPVLIGAFLPWVLFLPASLRDLRRSDPSPAARFSLLMALAAGTAFLFWSLSPAKNPHYALVLLPPLAALVGRRIAGWHGSGVRGRSWDVRSLRSVGTMAAAAVVGIASLVAAGGRALEHLTPPGRGFAVRIREEAGWEGAEIAVYRKRMPSLSFHAGRGVTPLDDAEEAEAFLRRPGPAFLVVRTRHRGSGNPDGPRCRVLAYEPRSGEDWLLIRVERPARLPGFPPPPAPAAAPPAAGPR